MIVVATAGWLHEESRAAALRGQLRTTQASMQTLQPFLDQRRQLEERSRALQDRFARLEAIVTSHPDSPMLLSQAAGAIPEGMILTELSLSSNSSTPSPQEARGVPARTPMPDEDLLEPEKKKPRRGLAGQIERPPPRAETKASWILHLTGEVTERYEVARGAAEALRGRLAKLPGVTGVTLDFPKIEKLQPRSVGASEVELTPPDTFPFSLAMTWQ